jgi:hypothetical protein
MSSAAAAAAASSSSSSSSAGAGRVPMDTTSAADNSPLTADEIAANPRKRPRHFHSGPHDINAVSPHLYRDALHHLYTFLTLKEMALTARTQKKWLAAADSSRPRVAEKHFSLAAHHRQKYLVDDIWKFDSLLVSPLRHQILSLQIETEQHQSPDHPYLTSLRMPHLTQLRFSLQVYAGMSEPRWPPLLIKLLLVIEEPPIDIEEPALVMPQEAMVRVHATIGRSIARLQRLEALQVRTVRLAPLLPPLIHLPALTQLDLEECEVYPEELDVIRRMPHLRKFVCDPEQFTADDLERLLSGDGPIPPLEELPAAVTFWAETVDLVLKLAPSLTKLDVGDALLEDVAPLLSQLKRVITLDLRVYDEIVQVDSLVSGLRSMPQLTNLALGHSQLATEHLSTVLPELKQLDGLSLHCEPALVTLAFLAHAPASLRQLTLQGKKSTPLVEARHLEKLPQLKSLRLHGVFARPFDDLSIARMTPGSEAFDRDAWPNLTLFEYAA